MTQFVNSPLQTRTLGPALLEDTITPWMGPLAPWARHVAVVDNEERARRWFAICVALSLLLHLALLLIPMAKQKPAAAASSQVAGPLTVHLTRAASHPPKEQPTPPPPAPRKQRLIAVPRSASTASTFVVPAEPKATPPEPEPQAVLPEDDMMARLNARRAQREAAEHEAALENAAAAAAGGGPSVNQRIMDNINRAKNGAVRGEGTGGVFEVTSIGVREGSFRFNGWHPESGDNWRESYTVDAGEGGNVQMAIVRKVIDVIRKYKKGDFDFESRRLGRTVTMSARASDTGALETFLMNELFGDNSSPRSRYQRQ